MLTKSSKSQSGFGGKAPWEELWQNHQNWCQANNQPVLTEDKEIIKGSDPVVQPQTTKTKKELEKLARKRLKEDKVSFNEIDKLEGHDNTVFNTYHGFRVMDSYYENAEKEGKVPSGETDAAYKLCSPALYFAINKLYNWSGDDKIKSGYIEDATIDGKKHKGINTLMKEKGLAGAEKRFWAMTKDGEMGTKANNDKIDHFPKSPAKWALAQSPETGVHVFTVSVMGGYHSMMLIVDRRGDGKADFYLRDQHHITASGFDRRKPHTVGEIDAYFMKMITDWNASSVPDNKTVRLMKLKRD